LPNALDRAARPELVEIRRSHSLPEMVFQNRLSVADETHMSCTPFSLDEVSNRFFK
jgi:hypothetical protein